MSRVFVAMSGGVDSSVTAALLKEAGYEVIGVSMHLWCEEKQGSGAQKKPCCSREDIADAQEVCRLLDIPHYVINFEKEFLEWVVAYFLKEYGQGRTPNPCLACNQYIKFNFLLNRILALGGDYLATGHYARIQKNAGAAPVGVFSLLKAVDEAKDQSYVLYTLGQKEMSHLLFPLGEYTKSRVRQIARDKGLPIAAKPDSQEICFVPRTSYSSFVGSRLPAAPGDVVDKDGRILGRHRGLCYHTVGQRRGLGISSRRPLFILRLDASANTVIVGGDKDLFNTTLFASKLNWVAGRPPPAPLEVIAKIRYKALPASAALFIEGENARVEFRTPQRAITPGQAVVFYQGEVVLGGGTID